MRYALHGSGTPQGNIEITKDASVLALPIMKGLTPSFSAVDEWYEYETTSKIFDPAEGWKMMYYLTNTAAISRSPAAPNHPVAWFR